MIFLNITAVTPVLEQSESCMQCNERTWNLEIEDQRKENLWAEGTVLESWFSQNYFIF